MCEALNETLTLEKLKLKFDYHGQKITFTGDKCPDIK